MADYKSTHTGAEIDAGIDKAVTADSNWSLLMANLGIGRWADQTLVNFSWQSSTFVDNLLPYYSNCIRFASNTKTNLTTIELNNRFKDDAIINFAFYNFNMPSNGTLYLKGRTATTKEWIYTCEATFMGFTGKKIISRDVFMINNRALQVFNNCSNLTHIENFDFSNCVERINCFDSDKIEVLKLVNTNFSFDLSSFTKIITSELLQNFIDGMVKANATLTINSTQNDVMTDTQRSYIVDTLGWTIAVA